MLARGITAGGTATIADGKIGVFADGATASGGETVASYTDLTDVAAFFAAALTETNGESYVAVINDLAGDDAYAYLIGPVAGGSIDSTEVSLIATLNDIGAALDTDDITS